MSLKPFPDVVIAAKLPGGVLARYMERAKPRRIEMTPDILLHERQTQMQIALHEIGHWFRNEHVPKNEMHDEESYAREFVSFFLLPGAFKKEHPERHARLSVQLQGQRGQILAFARKCLSRLDP